MAKSRGAACSVEWCACLAVRGHFACAVHRKHSNLHPAPVDGEASAFAVNPSDCAECGGSGECSSCDGDGEHYCGQEHCNDVHDCGACEGTGACRRCRPLGAEKKLSADELYLRWALSRYPWNDEARVIEWPWEDAA